MSPSAMTLIYQQDPAGGDSAADAQNVVISVNRTLEQGLWVLDVTAEWLPAGSCTSYTLPARWPAAEVQATADMFAAAMFVVHSTIAAELASAAHRLSLTAAAA